MKRLLFLLDLFLSRVAALLQPATGTLHTARFARLHELSALTDEAPRPNSLLLAIDKQKRVLQVKPTNYQKRTGKPRHCRPDPLRQNSLSDRNP